MKITKKTQALVLDQKHKYRYSHLSCSSDYLYLEGDQGFDILKICNQWEAYPHSTLEEDCKLWDTTKVDQVSILDISYKDNIFQLGNYTLNIFETAHQGVNLFKELCSLFKLPYNFLMEVNEELRKHTLDFLLKEQNLSDQLNGLKAIYVSTLDGKLISIPNKKLYPLIEGSQPKEFYMDNFKGQSDFILPLRDSSTISVLLLDPEAEDLRTSSQRVYIPYYKIDHAPSIKKVINKTELYFDYLSSLFLPKTELLESFSGYSLAKKDFAKLISYIKCYNGLNLDPILLKLLLKYEGVYTELRTLEDLLIFYLNLAKSLPFNKYMQEATMFINLLNLVKSSA